MEEHEGSIDVRSNLGQGTKFMLKFVIDKVASG